MKVPVTSALGGRIELPIRLMGRDVNNPRHRTGCIDITPWYEFSMIGQGAAVPITASGQSTGLTANEPSSTTNQFGVYISFEF